MNRRPHIEVSALAISRQRAVTEYIETLPPDERPLPALALAVACAAAATLHLQSMEHGRLWVRLYGEEAVIKEGERMLPGLRGARRREKNEDVTWALACRAMFAAEAERRERWGSDAAVAQAVSS